MKEKVDIKGPDYLSIVENSPDYIIRYNREFRHIYLNHAALRLIGASNQQIIGKTHRESGLYDQSECDYWEGKIRYVFKTGSLYQEQFDWQSQDTLMWLDRRLTPEYDESGNIISVLAVSHDITKLIEAEQAYRETQEIFHSFMLYSPIYVFFKDTEIRSLRLSKNFEQMLGRPMEELLGKTMDDLFPSDFAKKMVADDKRILYAGKSEVIEEEFNGKYYTTIKFPIILDGKPKYLAGYTIDITDRRQTLEALQISQAKYQTIFESTGSATMIVEEDNTISLANHECFSLTGYTQAELIGQKWTKYVEKESLEKMLKNHNLRLQNPSLAPKKYDVKLVNKNGETRYAMLDIGMVQDSRQSIVSILDITDRVKTEKALKVKADELERFNNLMLGRELKMIELKKEINRLLKKTGSKEKYRIPE